MCLNDRLQALNERGLETHLVDMADSILPNMADKEMITPPQDSLVKSGIHLHLNGKVSSLSGKEHVEKVLLGNGESIEFPESSDSSGLVIFAVGMRPNVQLFTDTKLETARENGKKKSNSFWQGVMHLLCKKNMFNLLSFYLPESPSMLNTFAL